MANPTPYTRGYSFTGFQTATPAAPLPGDEVDNELDMISGALTSTQAALADIRRSDGKLQNNIVTADSVTDSFMEEVIGMAQGTLEMFSGYAGDLAHFSQTWLGAQASNPTAGVGGAPLVAGMMYYNTVAKEYRAYTGSAWKFHSGVSQIDTYFFVATYGQVTFYGTDADGKAVVLSPGTNLVTINGVGPLREGVDYTLRSEGDGFVLATACGAGDEVHVSSFRQIDLTNVAPTVAADADRAEAAALIALSGSPYRLPDFASLATRLKYLGATGAQINVTAGAIVDVPGVGVYQVLASGASGAHLDYTGSGGVKLAVQPLPTGTPVEAFGAVQGPTLGVYADSYAAIQKALDWSAAGPGRTVYFSGDYAIGTTLGIAATASVLSDRKSIIRPMPSTGPSVGINIATGTAVGTTLLPQLHQFSSAGLVVIGTDIARFVVPQFHTCGIAVRIVATPGDTNVLDTVVEFDAIANCGCALEVSSSSGSDVIQGLIFRGNFVTETTTLFRRVGVACADDGPFIDVAAVDFTAGGGALCDNQISGHSIPRTTIRVSTWLGGAGFTAGTPTKLFKGLWDNADIDLCDAQIFDQNNLTPDLVRSSRWKTRNGVALGAAPALVPLGTALTSFNGGKMLWPSDFMAKVTLWAAIPAGSSVAASFFHVLADGSYQRWTATMQQGASGLIIEAVHDQSATVSGRVAVVLRNVSGSAIASGTTIYMAIKRG